jgi:hypothetical protein
MFLRAFDKLLGDNIVALVRLAEDLRPDEAEGLLQVAYILESEGISFASKIADVLEEIWQTW